MSIRGEIIALMRQRAARRIRRSLDGRWHLDEMGEVDGETVRDMIKDGTLVPETPGASIYVLSH